MKFGSKDIPFVYKGDKLIYPNPIKDGLLLWYDFKGMRNTDTNKEVAKDLSGNGNDGTLTNFNFTEGSGYKDNTLVFDGVDDKLQIPQLNLDSTAMSVELNGKTYSYDGDKVTSVEGDGRITVANKNLFPAFSRWQKGTMTSLEDYKASPIIGSNQSLIIEMEVKPNTDYTITFNSDHMRYYLNGIEGDSYESLSTESVEGSKVDTFNTGEFVLIRMTINSWSQRVSYERSVWNLKLEEGREQTPWVPAQEDFTSSNELVHTPLSSLQLYNKPLNKTELLHNAEKQSPKELKSGQYVQDGLILHYDFSHESNTSEYKGKAFDYSGNGNHGVLNNFNFTEESGYEGEGLRFDGVDDNISNIDIKGDNVSETHTFVVKIRESKRNNFLYAGEELKIDLYHNRIARADVNPSLSIRHNAGYETFYGALVKDGLEHTTYINGVVVDKAILNSTKSSRLMHIGNYIPDGRPSIDLYSVKMYSRALTPEEIAHDYAIEKEKFNITEGEI